MARGLVIGNGWLGKKIAASVPDTFLYSDKIKSERDIINLIDSHKPDFLINCAGKTGVPNVDWCETHKTETYFSNVQLPLLLAHATSLRRIRMIHLGSGCIYSGDNNGNGFSEADPPNFSKSYYSYSKAESERLLSGFPEILQLRLRMPFDEVPSERNLLDKLLKYTKENKPILSTPNSITTLPFFLSALKFLINGNYVGIFNVVNKGAITHKEILDSYSEQGGKISPYHIIDPEQFRSFTIAERSNCTLNVSKLEGVGMEVPYVAESVRECISEYLRNKDHGI